MRKEAPPQKKKKIKDKCYGPFTHFIQKEVKNSNYFLFQVYPEHVCLGVGITPNFKGNDAQSISACYGNVSLH